VVKLLDETSGSYELTPLNRWANIHRNDLENILPFLMAVAIYQKDGLKQLFIGIILIVAFSYSRVAHTAMYAFGLQPGRRIFFVIGMICNIIIASCGAMSSTGTLYNGNNTDGLELSYYTVGFQWIYALLVIKIYFVHFFTLLARNSAGQHASPEDRTPTVVQEKENSSVVERYLNLSRNDSENILPFFIASLLWQEYLSDIASDWFQLTGVILGGIFCACRFGHTIAYICEIQPWRTIFFFLGVIVTIVRQG